MRTGTGRRISRRCLHTGVVFVVASSLGVTTVIPDATASTGHATKRTESNGTLRRGPRAYCRALHRIEAEAQRDAERIERAGEGDPLSSFVAGAGLLADFPRYLRRLARKAPGNLPDDLYTAADAIESATSIIGDGVSDPLGALTLLFATSALAGNAMDRIDEFTLSACGQKIFGVD